MYRNYISLDVAEILFEEWLEETAGSFKIGNIEYSAALVYSKVDYKSYSRDFYLFLKDLTVGLEIHGEILFLSKKDLSDYGNQISEGH